jgi:conjugal transfer/type IV secretion protein DotA/TraY
MADTDNILNNAPSSDKSVGFLNDIFGSGWENIIHGEPSSGGAGSVLFEMFYAFNAVVLAGVTVLMFYVVSAGIAGTAHEGEALGRRYSTLWTPVRAAMAVSFLMPLPWAKLSLLQAIVLKFVFLSIGGADYLAEKTIDFMVSQNGAASVSGAPLPYAEGLAEEVLKNLVVQEYFIERESSEGTGITDTSSGNIKSFSFTAPRPDLAKHMGEIKVSCVQSGDSHCENEYQIAVELSENLRPIAKAIVSQWSGGANIPIDAQQETDYRQAIAQYSAATQQESLNVLKSIGSNEELNALSQSVKNNGWTWMGGYYWKIAKYNEDAQAKAAITTTISGNMNEDRVFDAAGTEINAVFERYRTFTAKIAKGRFHQRNLANSPGDAAGAWDLLGSFFSDALGSSIPFSDDTAMSGSAEMLANTIAKGDPINNLQKMGQQLINAGSNLMTLYAAAGVSSWVLDVASSLQPYNPLKSDGSNEGKGIASKILSSINGFIFPIALALLLAGITLAYYLPSVPFILWTSAIVGWLILTLELMVAAPIWAAMHAIPEGEGMAGQHGRQGYMLFLSILVRPAMHVFGFFISFVAIGVVGHFVGESYLDHIVANGQDDQPMGPVANIIAWLAVMLIGIGMMVVLTHKAFSLITWLPDNILRWAGSGAPSLGEGGDEQRTSHMFAAAVMRAQTAVSSGVSGASQVIKQDNQKDNKERLSKSDTQPALKAPSSSHHDQGDK